MIVSRSINQLGIGKKKRKPEGFSSISKMVVKKPYPRSTLRKILKTHSKRNLTKNVDILVSNLLEISVISIANLDF